MPIRASVDGVVATELGTVLGQGERTVGTVEHLLAALSGLGVDNVEVEVDGPELPILDGSAEPWVRVIDDAGLVTQDGPRRWRRPLSAAVVRDGDRFVRLEPSQVPGVELDVEVDFRHRGIACQRLRLRLNPECFRRELAPARTFGFVADGPGLRARGLARGASRDNALLFDDRGQVLGPPLRFLDEVVRHKALDALGDLALLGPLTGARYVARAPGHALNVALFRKMQSTLQSGS